VRNRIVQSVFLVGVLFAVSVMPAFAADGTAEFGLSTASSNVGLGVNGEYASKLKDMGTDRSSSWLVDIAYLHKGFDTFGSNFSVNAFQIQGGWRFTGKAGDKGSWHVQVAAGINRSSASLGGLAASVCDSVGIDCSASSTDFVITPAGAYTYWFGGDKGVKAQLNIPIAGGSSFTRFDVDFVLKMSK
jgi:hypothetical protein